MMARNRLNTPTENKIRLLAEMLSNLSGERVEVSSQRHLDPFSDDPKRGYSLRMPEMIRIFWTRSGFNLMNTIPLDDDYHSPPLEKIATTIHEEYRKKYAD